MHRRPLSFDGITALDGMLPLLLTAARATMLVLA
jgi:hypothetical protein